MPTNRQHGFVNATLVLALLWPVFWLLVFVAESLAWHTPLFVTASWAGVGLLFDSIGYAIWAPPAA